MLCDKTCRREISTRNANSVLVKGLNMCEKETSLASVFLLYKIRGAKRKKKNRIFYKWLRVDNSKSKLTRSGRIEPNSVTVYYRCLCKKRSKFEPRILFTFFPLSLFPILESELASLHPLFELRNLFFYRLRIPIREMHCVRNFIFIILETFFETFLKKNKAVFFFLYVVIRNIVVGT